MQEFAIGQRWLSDTESELGLGILIAVEDRTISILFPKSDETRIYARQNAPLSRVLFNVDEVITDVDGVDWRVREVELNNGVARYHVVGIDDSTEAKSDAALNTSLKVINETRLAAHLQLAKPLDKLLACRIEPKEWYDLRIETHLRHNQHVNHPLRGLLGPRVGLIPHQLYIAQEVGTRLAPRVLLADEVGLGKTIEAGLIIHQQLKTGRSERVLILVPDSLQYQWMIEMRRRFNLEFSIFDLERTASIREHDEEANPFSTEQLIIASVDLMLDHPDLKDEALEAGFDLLVVDEAHHLMWDEEQGGNDRYDLVEDFAVQTDGVLLLTATPEQLGVSSHFARLRLLDPQRYSNLDQFLQEEDQYGAVAALADALMNAPTLSAQTIAQTKTLTGLDLNDSSESRQQAITALLDRHGVGRNLFRNTRDSVKGFKGRTCQPSALPTPANWPSSGKLGEQMWPEEQNLDGDWMETDPRVPWLIQLLKTELKNQKVLLIARSGPVVESLEAVLRLNAGIKSSMFNENMSLLERDQAAAYFADDEFGAQILLCSEIGSEGRNFQFAHHLVLFDMPANPDVLEQRIGRLDRIGQTEQITIHVPYLKQTAQERMFRWYHQALNIFSQISPTAQILHENNIQALKTCLLSDQGAVFDELLEEVQASRLALEAELQEGRDRLLEFNSCRPQVAEQIVEQLQQYDDNSTLEDFTTRFMSATNIDYEEQHDGTLILKPSDQILIEGLPLNEEGATATFNRDLALKRDDVEYLSLEHPLLESIFDTVKTQGFGATSIAILQSGAMPAATVLLEVWFRVEVIAPKVLNLQGSLPQQYIRVFINEKGQDLGAKVGHMMLKPHVKPVDINTARNVAKLKREPIAQGYYTAENMAKAKLAEYSEQAQHTFSQKLQHEIDRMQYLRSLNPSIRLDEIERLQKHQQDGLVVLKQLALVPDALRVLVVVN